MNADMARWIEAAAKAAYEQYNRAVIGCCEPSWNDLDAAHRQRMIDAQQAAARAFLQASQADSVKLTPRAGTPEMYGAMIAKRLDDGRVDRHWQAGHDAAPDYLGE
jgi:hypothetical protein